MDAMTLFVLAAAGAAVVAFTRGIASMAHGGDADQLHSHELMFERVGWQGLAILLLLLALLAA